MPPGPVSVKRRICSDRRRAHASSSSCLRPTKGVGLSRKIGLGRSLRFSRFFRAWNKHQSLPSSPHALCSFSRGALIL